MIRDWTIWESWERDYHRGVPPNYQNNLRIFEALYQEAILLGILPTEDPLTGLEDKIRLAKALNVSGNPQEDRAGV